MRHEFRDAIRIALASCQPAHLPFGDTFAVLGNEVGWFRLVDPLPLANKHEGLFRAWRRLRKRQGLLILRKGSLSIVTTAFGIEPHTVFKHIVAKISGTGLCEARICSNLRVINC